MTSVHTRKSSNLAPATSLDLVGEAKPARHSANEKSLSEWQDEKSTGGPGPEDGPFKAALLRGVHSRLRLSPWPNLRIIGGRCLRLEEDRPVTVDPEMSHLELLACIFPLPFAWLAR